MAKVEFRGVRKAWGEHVVLHDIQLTVLEGEFLVLVGPSGCGKSTLLRTIAGLEEITGGDLFIGDRRANDLPPADRDVAMVFQSYALYPHMTVRENMAFALRLRKVPQAEIVERVDAAARLLALDGLLDRLPKAMSGGQRQRVAMGRAIVRQPQVFLFDEPLSNLDLALRTQTRAEIKKLHRRLGTTMVYVTHDQIEAMTLADRIAVLRAGRLQQVGRPQELYERPANRFVGSFIGSPGMSFLRGKWDGSSFRGEGVEYWPADGHGPATEAADLDLGLRPHDLALGAPGRAPIQGVVDLVEPSGWEAHVHVRVGDVALIVRVETAAVSELQVGQPVGLRPEPGRARWFRADEAGLAC
jgi:multiple sugar transport system ATP-binding protein